MTKVSSEPLVSVLVPLYNHTAYVVECLDSIRDEDYPRLELLVLDDGSKDDSLVRAREWIAHNTDRFERVWIETQPNQGICKTLNRLQQASRGEFVALAASDDALVRGGIRARVDYLVSHPKYLAVFADAEMMDSRGKAGLGSVFEKHGGDKTALRDPKRLVRELLLFWCVGGPVFMARRIVFDPQKGVGGYDESLSFEDLDMYMRLMSRKALGFVDMTVGRYRIHEANTCRSDSHRAVAVEEYRRIYSRNASLFHGVNRIIIELKKCLLRQALEGIPLTRRRHILAARLLQFIKQRHRPVSK